MIELSIMIAAIVGAAAGGTMGLLMSWAAGMYGRRPYSSAAIVFRATSEDAARLKSRMIDPSVGEEWPEPMTARTNNGPEPSLPKLPTTPKPQPPFRRN